jgi:hypothetical protein
MGVQRQTVARLDADNAEWRLTSAWALALAATPLVVAAIGLVTAPFESIYRTLADEDGLLEWIQVAVLLAVIALAAALLVALWRRGHRLLALLYLVATVGAIFVAGEEVSWGQRIIGFVTPSALEDVNRQGETNVHNIGSVLALFNLGIMAVSIGAIVLPFLRWTVWRDRARSVAGYVLIPPLALGTAFAIPLVYRAVRLVVLPDAGARVTKFQEFAELCFYLGLAAFFFLALRAIRSGFASDQGT